jgi:hypothetical protein
MNGAKSEQDMEYDKLTPSDWGLINMVASLTQQEIKPVCGNKSCYSFRYTITGIDKSVRLAILRAIEGRAGERLASTMEAKGDVFIFIRYSTERLPHYAGPVEYTDPYAGAGLLYCRKLDECRALQVRRDNVEQLILFVGGGELETPDDGPATFHFLNASGSIWAHALEGDYLIAERPGLFKIVPADEFEAIWERKY